jgi:hypothetical protein
MAKTRKKAISEPPSMPQVGDKVYPGKSEMLYEISHVSHDGAEVNLHVPRHLPRELRNRNDEA